MRAYRKRKREAAIAKPPPPPPSPPPPPPLFPLPPAASADGATATAAPLAVPLYACILSHPSNLPPPFVYLSMTSFSDFLWFP